MEVGKFTGPSGKDKRQAIRKWTALLISFRYILDPNRVV
jgi:hypothetical protein